MRKYLMLVCIVLTISVLFIGCGTGQSNTATDTDSTNVTATPIATVTVTPSQEPTIEPTQAAVAAVNMDPATVYMTREISPESLIRIYEALGRKASGKVAVKVHMGEPGGHNYLSPDLVKDFVLSVNGTFVDCNTAYGGRRANTAAHMQAAEDHGFTAYTSVDILDAEGEIKLPVKNGKHLTEDVVGSHFEDYDFIVVLSHFKGHEMGGFGGAIKNMSIGFASTKGKNMIHNAGKGDTNSWLSGGYNQDEFLESMAEAAKAVADTAGENILYISVMNNISIDCDCNPYPAKPVMKDIGILASLDPVALDKACVDLVNAAPEEENRFLVKRIKDKNGTHTLDYGQEIGLGTQKYKLVNIDE